jgi:hypothetical protein
MLHRYSTVAEEVRHRVNARVAAYERAVPEDVLRVLGPKPAAPEDCGPWMKALHVYAETCLAVGAEADVLDAALLAGPRWRDASNVHQQTVTGETEPSPALRPAM